MVIFFVEITISTTQNILTNKQLLAKSKIIIIKTKLQKLQFVTYPIIFV